MAVYASRRRRRGLQIKGREGRWAHTFAALDLGTNNCRLLVAKPKQDGFRVIDAFSRIVRLGEGLGSCDRLSDAAMDRTLLALNICAQKIKRDGVDRLRAVATEACRRAENSDSFFARVSEHTGLNIEVITQAEEARLAYSSCRSLLEGSEPYAVVFDIGGGSTQILWLDLNGMDSPVLDWISVPLGVITLTERHGTGRLSAEAYRKIVCELDSHLTEFCARNRIAEKVAVGDVQMLGTSGTVTTLTGIDHELECYNRSKVDGATLNFTAIFEISNKLRMMSVDERAAEPCIGYDRADLVIAGCAVLGAICKRWPVGQLRVADRGIREGILWDLMVQADSENASPHENRDTS
ncbi:Ppx/GppA family phosphatase [Alphaproteobacteria bacterium]|jgi:exopolyphosphatase/guanosine-5'-triphosphate,3'-diphosphate pyrophosphatase|nr:Ppx/GppA family phosphatase [Alphaproteobacteria bacterium]